MEKILYSSHLSIMMLGHSTALIEHPKLFLCSSKDSEKKNEDCLHTKSVLIIFEISDIRKMG